MMPDSKLWVVPRDWTWVAIGDVANVVGGGTPRTTDPANFDGGTVPWITPADLSGYVEKHIRRGERNITVRGLEGSAARLLPTGTVLFSSRAPIGYVAIAGNPLATNQGFKSFVLPSNLSPDYVYYYLQRAKTLAVGLASGTTFPEISGRQAAKIPLPIAPLSEQHRIVDAVESYFTRLDDAVATLERVQRNLQGYRASVLKAAVEGRLVPTEAELARAEGHDYEPASVYLERILAERRRRWEEAELAKMKAKGKVPTDDRWKAKYKEPVAPNTAELPGLPEGWCWASLSQVCDTITDGDHQPPPQTAEGIPFLVIGNVRLGFLDFSNTRFVPKSYYESLDGPRKPRPGDLLYTVTGSYGIPVRVLSDTPFCVQRHIAILRPTGYSNAGFLYYMLQSQAVFEQAARTATGTAQKTVGLASLRNFAVPLPPDREQVRIHEALEDFFSLAESTKTTARDSQLRCDRLRQSILKWAFEGKLVDQDPIDEPASVLLERIKVEQESSDGRRPNSGRHRERTSTNP